MSFPDGGYSSHLQALAWALARTTGDIVEYGGGWYSTPLFHGHCEATGRELYTVETDEWMANQLAQGWGGRVGRTPESIGVPKKPGLVFIDDGDPALRSNYLAVSGGAQLVVVHDTEPASEPNYPGMREALEQYRYRRDWTVFPWWTTIVSNTVEL